MQILRQALFQKLSGNILHFAIIRNKIACITQNQLIVLSIDSQSSNKKVSIPMIGSMIHKFILSKDHICLLQRSGTLTIRRLDRIKQIEFSTQGVKLVDVYYPHLKWWEDELHIIYDKYFEEINVCLKTKQKINLPFQLKKNQRLVDLQFCDLFLGIKNVLYLLDDDGAQSVAQGEGPVVIFSLNGVCLGKLRLRDSQHVSSSNNNGNNKIDTNKNMQLTSSSIRRYRLPTTKMLRLCHPLQDDTGFNKQYLAVLVNNQKLKIYDIITMKLVFVKEIAFCCNADSNINTNQLSSVTTPQTVEMQTDDLNEYLILKRINQKSKKIENVYLMKINKEHYFSSFKENLSDIHNTLTFTQPFFMFDIQIAMKQNLKLFPSHSQIIKNTLCDSVDTCYCDNNQVHIASIVMQANYKDELFSSESVAKMQRSVIQQTNINNSDQTKLWAQIVWAKMNPKQLLFRIVQKYKRKGQEEDDKNIVLAVGANGLKNFDYCLEQEFIIQNILNNLKACQEFSAMNLNEKSYQVIKDILYIEYFPMLTDIMSIEVDEPHRTTRELLDKSNQDNVSNTMTMSSGFSTPVQQHSPRSSNKQEMDEKGINREIQNVQNQNEIKKDGDFDAEENGQGNHSNYDKGLKDQRNSVLHELNQFQKEEKKDQIIFKGLERKEEYEQLGACSQCQQLQDYASLNYIQRTFTSICQPISDSLQTLDHTLDRLQTLNIHQAQTFRYRTKRHLKAQKNIKPLIQKQFNQSLQTMKNDITFRLGQISRKFKQKSQNELTFKRQARTLAHQIEQSVELCKRRYQRHKKQSDDLLVKLYDLESDQKQKNRNENNGGSVNSRN